MGLGKTYSTQYLADSNNNTGTAGQVLSTTSTGIDWVDANTVIGTGFWLESGNDIYNSNSANVGIGTNAPLYKLHNIGTSRLEGRVTLGGDVNNFIQGNGASLEFKSNGDYIFNKGYDRLLTILSSGNVGIGTTNPGAKLNIKGSVSTALTGTVSVTIATTAVVGVGTLFTTELEVGDAIKIGTEIFTVATITDALNLNINSAHVAGASAVIAYSDSTLFNVNTGEDRNLLTVDKSGLATFASSVDLFRRLKVKQPDIGDGESVGLAILNASETQQWNITTGRTNVNNVSFNVRNSTANVDAFYINTNNSAHFASSVSATGTVTGSNLSGTNTGDQDLSSFLTASSTQSKYLRSDTADSTTSKITLGNIHTQFGSTSDPLLYTSRDKITLMSGGTSGTYIEIDDENDTVEASGSMKAASFVKNGGTSSQFLKANGSTDDNTYLTYHTAPYAEQIALSDETTALTTGTSKVTFRAPDAITVSTFRLSCATAPTGSVITVDVNVGGVSMLSTKLTIDAGEKTSATAVAPVVIGTGLNQITDDSEITIDIDGVGSTVAGAGLKLIMYYKYTFLA